MSQERTPRKSPSHPRIKAEGWENLDPTTIIQRSRERLHEATDEARRHIDHFIPRAPVGDPQR